MIVNEYVPAGVVGLVVSVNAEELEVLIEEGAKLAVTPGIAEIPSKLSFTVPVIPPIGTVVKL